MNNMFTGMPFGGMMGNTQIPADPQKMPGNMPQKGCMPFLGVIQPAFVQIMIGMWIAYAKMWEYYGRQCESFGKKLEEMLAEQAGKMPQPKSEAAKSAPAGKGPSSPMASGMPGFGMNGLAGVLPKDMDMKKIMEIAKIFFSASKIDYDYEE